VKTPKSIPLDLRIADARDAGVSSLLVDRAARMVSDGYGTRDVLAFVDFLLDLIRSRPVEWPLVGADSLSSLERAETMRLISSAMDSTSDAAEIELLTMLSFQIEDRSPLDPEVKRFVEDGLETAIARRRDGPPARAKHFDREDARATLLEAKGIFEQNGKRFFLDRGTLLGAIRESDFIASDYDIDLGVFADEVTLDEIKEMFQGTNFRLNQNSDFKVGLISSSGIQLDLFSTRRERGYFVSSGYRDIHHWYFSPFELSEYEFLGETFLIPSSFERHLAENYGNWRTPTAFYDLSYDEPCVVYGRSAKTIEYLTRRMSDALGAGSRFLAERPARALRDCFAIDYTDWFAERSLEDVGRPEGASPSSSPIVIVDDFHEYGHRLRRIVESALSISSAVDLCVVEGGAGNLRPETVPYEDQMLVAGSIDRIRQVTSIPHIGDPGFEHLLHRSPLAVVVHPSSSQFIDRATLHRFDTAGCQIVSFGRSSIALTVATRGLVTVREASVATVA
jgi:hypothetical protein